VSLLRAEALGKRYRSRQVVANLSLEVSSGEVVGLLGPNGAGKTTAFYMIVGLVPCDSGRIWLDDRELTALPMHRRARLGLGYLPPVVAHNDFIFSVIAEEKGFLGSVTVLSLYAVVLFGGIRIAGQARDRLGKVMAVGVVTLLFSHVFINIGMNIRIMPVTGVPLPLLSYGGSSVLGSLIAIGILQNVYIHRKTY